MQIRASEPETTQAPEPSTTHNSDEVRKFIFNALWVVEVHDKLKCPHLGLKWFAFEHLLFYESSDAFRTGSL